MVIRDSYYNSLLIDILYNEENRVYALNFPANVEQWFVNLVKIKKDALPSDICNYYINYTEQPLIYKKNQ